MHAEEQLNTVIDNYNKKHKKKIEDEESCDIDELSEMDEFDRRRKKDKRAPADESESSEDAPQARPVNADFKKKTSTLPAKPQCRLD